MSLTHEITHFAGRLDLRVQPSTPPPPAHLPSPHHGGEVFELPDAHGFVELIVERGVASKGDRKAQNKSRIVAYIYQPDATTAMSPAPTDLKITLGASAASGGVRLVPDPNERGKFASEPGIYPAEPRGQIDFELGGKTIQAKFSFR